MISRSPSIYNALRDILPKTIAKKLPVQYNGGVANTTWYMKETDLEQIEGSTRTQKKNNHAPLHSD